MVSNPGEIANIDQLLTSAEETHGLRRGSVLISPRLETAEGLRVSYEIARASRRIAYMGAGTAPQGDLERDVGYKWTPSGMETLYFRSKVLLDVRAAGVSGPVTGIWADVSDLEGLRAFATQSREIGYRGLVVIHPSHVPIANEIFSPSAKEVSGWRAVISQMTTLQEQGIGAGLFDGRMIDAANIKTAEQGLLWAESLGLGSSE
jgi:citrate lyase subunit beta/citryl-CoA lyase